MKFNSREPSPDHISLPFLKGKSESDAIKEFSKEEIPHEIDRRFSPEHFFKSASLYILEKERTSKPFKLFSEVSAEFLRELKHEPSASEDIEKLLPSLTLEELIRLQHILQPLKEQKFKKIMEQINIMIIKELIAMVERGEPIDPEMLSPANLKILTPEEDEGSLELSRKLEERANYHPSYKQALRNLTLSQLAYERRRGAQEIKEYYQKLGKPIPSLLKQYVEGIE